MKINELIVETQADEGIGSMIGKGVGAVAKGVGAVAGGAVGAWDAAKKGFASGRATVAGDPDPSATDPSAAPGTAPAGTAPAAGGSAPVLAPSAPATSGGGSQQAFNSAMAAIKTLSPTQKSALAGQLTKEIGQGGRRSAPAGGQTPSAGASAIGNVAKTIQATQPPAASSTGGATQQTQTGQVHKANPNNPNNQQAAPAYSGPNWDEVTGEPLSPKAKAEYAQFSPEQKAEIEQNIANKKQATTPAAEVPAPAPAATTPAVPATTPAAPAGSKMTQQQMNAMKAKIAGQKAAGKDIASQTGGGFQNYVAGSPNTRGFDAQGNALPNTIKRESVEFYSRFLGKQI